MRGLLRVGLRVDACGGYSTCKLATVVILAKSVTSHGTFVADGFQRPAQPCPPSRQSFVFESSLDMPP